MSTKDKPIHFEPHPVSSERKAELVAEGVRIIDAVFAPAGWQPDAEGQGEDKPAKLTVDELRAVLTEAGVDFDPKAKKPELQALFDALPPADAEGQGQSQE